MGTSSQLAIMSAITMHHLSLCLFMNGSNGLCSHNCSCEFSLAFLMSPRTTNCLDTINVEIGFHAQGN